MTIVKCHLLGTKASVIEDWDMTNVSPDKTDLRVERFGIFLHASDGDAPSLRDVLEDIRIEMKKRGCHGFRSLTPRGGECFVNGVHVSFVGSWQGIRLDLILRGLRAAPLDESPFYTVHKARFAEQYNDDLTKLKPEFVT